MIETAITMGGSAVLGFALTFMDNIRQDKADERKYLLDRTAVQEDSMNNAEKRGGVWMRRFVVFILISLFAIISLGLYEPTNIVNTIQGESYLWGLIELAPTTEVITLKGALIDDTLKTSILSIIAFLFGQDTARK